MVLPVRPGRVHASNPEIAGVPSDSVNVSSPTLQSKPDGFYPVGRVKGVGTVADVRSRLAGDERPRHLNAHERHLRRQADHVRNFVLNLRLTCLGVLALSVEGLTGNRFTFTGISYYILVEFTESFTKSV